MLLLRLFPAYRRLQSELERESATRIELEDRLRLLTARLEQIEGQALQAKSETIQAQKEITDFLAFSLARRTVHGTPVSQGLPEPEMKPTPRSGIHGRALVNEKLRQFYQNEEAQSA